MKAMISFRLRQGVLICTAVLAMIGVQGCTSTRVFESEGEVVKMKTLPWTGGRDMDFRIVESRWASVHNGQKPVNRFLIVKAELKNNGKGPMRLKDKYLLGFTVLDENDVVYRMEDAAMVGWHMRSINPGVHPFEVVFDVPEANYRLRGYVFDQTQDNPISLATGLALADSFILTLAPESQNE